MSDFSVFSKSLKSVILCFLVTIGSYSFSLLETTVYQGFYVLSICLLLGLSSFLTGGVLGFIFGLPVYNNKRSNRSRGKENETIYERNNSLKEISDWITKIFVGLTLVELKSIIENFKKSVVFISEYTNVGESMRIVSACIIILFFILGFITLYLLTVTDIFKLIASNNRKIDDILYEGNVGDEYNLSEINNEVLLNSIDAGTKSEILKLADKVGIELSDANHAKAIGKKLFLLKEYTKSADFLSRAYELNNNDISSRLNEGYIRSKYLKQTEMSNKILNELISLYPENPLPYYNYACNLNREYIDIKDEDVDDTYKTQLIRDIKKNMIKVFKLDNGLLSEALKDPALAEVDIKSYFSIAIKDD